MFSLKDKVALVTGASQGIGRDTALALAEAGAKVAVAARTEEKLAALVSDIAAAGGTGFAVKMDVADAEQVKTGFKQVLEKFGRLDILVNNAAITRDGLAMRMKADDWEAVLRTNLTGAHLCIQQALPPMMKARAGRIINISSVVAQSGNAGQANYVAAKAGIIGLTKAIDIEIASRNITVNAVAPGFVVTPMTDVLPEKVKEELRLRNFNDKNLSLLFEVLNFKGNTQQKIDFLNQKFASSDKGKKGVTDFSDVLSLLKGFGAAEDHLEFDISLARGLSYYTGCIFEVVINNVGIGSVSGGGRYDNLTAVFDAKEKSSGVGFSFGIDRLYDAMEELKIFPKEATASSTVLIVHLDEASFNYGLRIAQLFREKEIACEIYPDQAKIKKQMEYADKKKIPSVIVLGSEEVKTEILTLKKMETGDQLKLSLPEITSIILSNK